MRLQESEQLLSRRFVESFLLPHPSPPGSCRCDVCGFLPQVVSQTLCHLSDLRPKTQWALKKDGVPRETVYSVFVAFDKMWRAEFLYCRATCSLPLYRLHPCILCICITANCSVISLSFAWTWLKLLFCSGRQVRTC